MDLEMTGLEADRHVIVEIATLVTDDDLVVVAEGPDLVIGATDVELAAMDDFVRDMHTSSGLLDEIVEAQPFLVRISAAKRIRDRAEQDAARDGADSVSARHVARAKRAV